MADAARHQPRRPAGAKIDTGALDPRLGSPFRGLYGGAGAMRRARGAPALAGPLFLDPYGDGAERERALAWLGGRGPLEVEVGFGRGVFFAARAEQVRGKASLLGFEVRTRACRELAAKLQQVGATHTRLVQADARPILAAMIPDGRITAVHVSFPDPWWKKRHHKRRFFSSEVVDVLAAKLAPGGAVLLRTDVATYADAICALFEEHPAFRVGDLAPDALPPSYRERRCAALGLAVRRHRFERITS